MSENPTVKYFYLQICSMHVREEKWIQHLVGKPERKTTLGRPRYRWEYNITMGLQGTGCGMY
jgi:hypothetical protein